MRIQVFLALAILGGVAIDCAPRRQSPSSSAFDSGYGKREVQRIKRTRGLARRSRGRPNTDSLSSFDDSLGSFDNAHTLTSAVQYSPADSNIRYIPMVEMDQTPNYSHNFIQAATFLAQNPYLMHFFNALGQQLQQNSFPQINNPTDNKISEDLTSDQILLDSVPQAVFIKSNLLVEANKDDIITKDSQAKSLDQHEKQTDILNTSEDKSKIAIKAQDLIIDDKEKEIVQDKEIPQENEMAQEKEILHEKIMMSEPVEEEFVKDEPVEEEPVKVQPIQFEPVKVETIPETIPEKIEIMQEPLDKIEIIKETAKITEIDEPKKDNFDIFDFSIFDQIRARLNPVHFFERFEKIVPEEKLVEVVPEVEQVKSDSILEPTTEIDEKQIETKAKTEEIIPEEVPIKVEKSIIPEIPMIPEIPKIPEIPQIPEIPKVHPKLTVIKIVKIKNPIEVTTLKVEQPTTQKVIVPSSTPIVLGDKTTLKPEPISTLASEAITSTTSQPIETTSSPVVADESSVTEKSTTTMEIDITTPKIEINLEQLIKKTEIPVPKPVIIKRKKVISRKGKLAKTVASALKPQKIKTENKPFVQKKTSKSLLPEPFQSGFSLTPFKFPSFSYSIRHIPNHRFSFSGR